MAKLKDVIKETSFTFFTERKKGPGICSLVGTFILLIAIVITVSQGATGALVLFPIGLIVLVGCLARGMDKRMVERPSAIPMLAEKMKKRPLLTIGILLGAFGLMPIGPFIFMGWLMKHLSSQATESQLLFTMAEKFERNPSISGSDYGRFLVILERAAGTSLLPYNRKQVVISVLKSLMIEKGHRISGSDYVELEKELTMAVTDQGDKVFSAKQVEAILIDYEKLREEIRDRSTINP